MKKTLLLLGALLAFPIFTHAQDANTPPAGGPPPGGPGGHHHDMAFLTDAQKAELKKAHDAAIAANPDLGKQEEQLRSQMQPGTPPTDEQKEQFKAFRDKMDQAMIAADPNVAPIIAEIKAHHHGHGGPPPASTGTSGASGT